MTNTKSIQSTSIHGRRTLAARALASGLAGAMLAFTGCAADPDASERLGERELVESAPEIVAELETEEGAQLTFTLEYESGDGSGDPVVAITELAPVGAPPYLERLRQLGATSLESFLALAPEGAEAPAVLRSAHEREAAQLGRSAEVRDISLASVLAATTFDSATCDSYAAFTASVASWLSELTGSSTNDHSLVFESGGNVAAAMCNYDSDRVDYKHAQFCHEVRVQGSDLGLLYCEPFILVPDGHRVGKSWLGATSDRLVRAKKLENYTLTVTSYIAIGGIPPVE